MVEMAIVGRSFPAFGLSDLYVDSSMTCHVSRPTRPSYSSLYDASQILRSFGWSLAWLSRDVGDDGFCRSVAEIWLAIIR